MPRFNCCINHQSLTRTASKTAVSCVSCSQREAEFFLNILIIKFCFSLKHHTLMISYLCLSAQAGMSLWTALCQT